MKTHFLFLIFSCLLTLAIGTSLLYFDKAFGDGLFEENLPPATIGDREASLYTKISPPVLTSDSGDKKSFTLRLFDAKNNKTIEHVSYFITVQKDGKLLMRDLFHSHQGTLKIKINSREGLVNVFGSQEPFQGGWTSETGDVTVAGPILLTGGLYHFGIEIFGIDYDRNIFVPENAPRFDAYLSVGDIFKDHINYKNKQYNLTIISYYDRVQNFTFDEQSKKISWEMPFNWDPKRIEEQKIFIHEEIKIPEEFKAFIQNGTSFDARAEDQKLSGRSVVLDPYTDEQNLIIHLLINKGDLLKLMEQRNNSTLGKDDGEGLMTFSLMPSGENKVIPLSEILTDTGGIQISLNWAPKEIQAQKETSLQLGFFDGIKDEAFKSDIDYNLVIFNQNGDQILNKNQISQNGIAVEKITFPEKGQYLVEIKINSIKDPVLNIPDQTRKGIGRTYVDVN